MPSDDSFLNNGIVFPDRTPQPALYEVKKAHEYLNFKHKGIQKDSMLRVLVENLYDFTNGNQFQIQATIEADGTVLKSNTFNNLDIPPHTGKLLRIPLGALKVKANTEYFVRFSATTKKEWGLLPAGYEVAKEQFALPSLYQEKAKQLESKVFPKLEVQETALSFRIYNQDVNVIFDKKSGRIQRYNYKGEEQIKPGKGPKLNFWRSPTDNDFGNKMQLQSIEWKKASLFAEVVEIAKNRLSEDRVRITVRYKLPGVDTYCNTIYTCNGDGSIHINNNLEASAYKGDIPRIGMRMQVPKAFDRLTYFGRGPWENYSDRKTSALVGLYQTTVKKQYVPYIRPQENGYKTDVRWLALYQANGNGLLVVSGEQLKPLSFSALHMPNEDFDATIGLDYGQEQLNESYRIAGESLNLRKHTTDIKEQDLVQLNIDFAQRGLGGDDSWWSKPQQHYLLQPNRPYAYSFYLIPFVRGNKEQWINTAKMR